MGFYDYSVPAPKGAVVNMSDFEGKVVMVVNTATGCGFTPQYKDIESMYEKYHDSQLHYNTMFPQMKKADVNGENELPLYTYLKSQQGFKGFGHSPKGLMMAGLLKTIDRKYKENSDIKWNFTKFIVDREGNVVARFEPTENMKDVEACVEKLL